MNWSEVWRWFTTSKYERSLEARILELQAEIDRLRTDNRGLQQALTPALRQIRTEADAVREFEGKPAPNEKTKRARDIMRAKPCTSW